MLTIILLIECLFACDLNTILDAGISSDCDLSPIKVFSETEEISFMAEAFTMTTGLAADSLPVGGSLLGQVTKLILEKTSENDEYVFQEHVNAQFAKFQNCINEQIKRSYFQTELSKVSVFNDIKQCNDKFVWGEIEDCLDNDWDDFKEDIEATFGARRIQEEGALDYSQKFVLYNVMSNGFRFFVTSYLDLVYNTIMSTEDVEIFETECTELYVMIEDAYEIIEIFEDWVNDAFDSLASYYTAKDISNDVCPASNPSDNQMLLNVNRVDYDLVTKKVYNYPIEGDREFKGYAFYKYPRAVKGADITPVSGEYNSATDSFRSEFSVNFNININGAMCNFPISCNSAVTKATVYNKYGLDKITEYRPNMDSCCTLISQKRSQIIANINSELIEWKKQQKENYNNIMTKFQQLFLEIYPEKDLDQLRANGEKPQCDDLERILPDGCTSVNLRFDYESEHDFTAIDVSAATDGTVLALDSNGNSYYRVNNQWVQLPEPYSSSDFKQISVGSSQQIWAINQWSRSYKYVNNQWVADNIFIQISVARDGTVIFARDTNNKLYKRYPGGSSWIKFDSRHSYGYVSVGSSNEMWMTNTGATGNRAYECTGLSGNQCQSLIWRGCSPTACFSQLAVGADGTAIGIDETNDIYYYNDNQWQNVCGFGVSKFSVVTKDNIWAIINGKIAIGHFN